MVPAGPSLEVAAPTVRNEGARRAARWPLFVFVAGEILALPLLLRSGRKNWFFVDDWDFLTSRSAGSVRDLFRPHQSHWSTLPVLVYRGLWTIFGLRYAPYQVIAVLLHLTVAALLLVVMRRADVGAWLSTLAALVVVFFGYGAEDVLVAFQMTWTMTLVFGLTHLLLADHDGPWNAKDGYGLLAGLAGLLCSGVALTMICVVGIATWLRRGWRVALAHTLPLGAVFVVWYGVIGHEQTGAEPSTIRSIFGFAITGLATTFARLTQPGWAGLGLLLVLAAGLTLRLRERRVARVAAPVAMLAGTFVFLLIAGVGRSNFANATFFGANAHGGTAHARQSRYIYVCVVLAMPAIAVAAQSVARKWRAAGVVAVVLLLSGVPANISRFSQFRQSSLPVTSAIRPALLTAPRLATASQLPRRLRPQPLFAPSVTMGWLRDALRAGRLPEPTGFSAVDAATLTLELAFQSSPSTGESACAPVKAPVKYLIERGEKVRVLGAPLSVAYVAPDGTMSVPTTVRPGTAHVVAAGPLTLRFEPTHADTNAMTATLCSSNSLRRVP